jgi:rRNA-processing protein FCF1
MKNVDYFDIKFINGKIQIPIKKGIIVDSNIMLLFLVGCYDISYIHMFKRTIKYTEEEYYFIRDLLNTNYYKDRVYTSPHILTELSNLSTMQGERRRKYFNIFSKILDNTCEIYIEKNKILKFQELSKFGITEIGIYKMAKECNLLVLTDDFRLSSYLSDKFVDVINLRNISKYLWSPD